MHDSDDAHPAVRMSVTITAHDVSRTIDDVIGIVVMYNPTPSGARLYELHHRGVLIPHWAEALTSVADDLCVIDAAENAAAGGLRGDAS